jgi:hypothetical protein
MLSVCLYLFMISLEITLSGRFQPYGIIAAKICELPSSSAWLKAEARLSA